MTTYAQPTWTNPEPQAPKMSILRQSSLPEFSKITDILVSLLRQSFSDPDNILSPVLKNSVLWSRGQTGNIVIDRAGNTKTVYSNLNQGILVQRGDYDLKPVGYDSGNTALSINNEPQLASLCYACEIQYIIYVYNGLNHEGVENLHDEIFAQLFYKCPVVNIEGHLWSILPIQGKAVSRSDGEAVPVPKGSWFSVIVVNVQSMVANGYNKEEPF
jgi:hypothetical protein